MTAHRGICLGIAILIAAIPLASNAQAPSPPAAAVKPAEPTGDLAFGRFIALIRGHLLTGEELVKRRDWSEAYPHFTYPTEEIYGVIRDELRAYNTPPFEGALKALARAVKARNAKEYANASGKMNDALAKADAGLKTKVSNWPRFEVAVAVEVLETALEEYDEAIADGRIVHGVGYRTARGFVLQADRMIEDNDPVLAAENATALAEMRAGIARIKPAFASLNAPAQPTIDDAAFLGAISQIRAAAGKITAAD